MKTLNVLCVNQGIFRVTKKQQMKNSLMIRLCNLRACTINVSLLKEIYCEQYMLPNGDELKRDNQSKSADFVGKTGFWP
jgi:hypothetical protein